ncbi:MAG: polar amino acid transport system substrate-binding protein [Myxococcota bacterium]|jgi:polar amino acid transport system substrate-binding protein
MLSALLLLAACDSEPAPPAVVPEPAAPAIDRVTFLTEEYPPLSYTHDGQLDGAAVALLEAVLAELGSKKTRADVSVVPWSDGYARAKSDPDTCLFSMTYTDERAPLFQWAGPISDTRIVVMARKDAGVSIDSAADLGTYTHGVFLDDIGQQLLASAGVAAEKVRVESDAAVLMKDLAEGTIQTWAYEEASARFQLARAGYSVDDFETVYVLKESTTQYAFSLGTSPELIAAFSAALGSVQASGERQKILDAYSK